MDASKRINMAVNVILSQYCSSFQFQDYSYFYDLHQILEKNQDWLVTKQTDKTSLCEFNVGLWEKSLNSAIDCLLGEQCTDSIVKEFFNYLLNSHPYTDFGLLEDFFHRLLFSYPPRTDTMNYYKEILCTSYITFNGHSIEEQGMFECLLETFFNCLNDPDYSEFNSGTINKVEKVELLHLPENFYAKNLSHPLSSLNKKNVLYFEDLCWYDKMKRCLTAMNFIYNVFETDLYFWLKSEIKNINSDVRPLFCYILWPDKRDTGLLNKLTGRITKLFILGIKLERKHFVHFNIIKKLINLLIEVIRLCDAEEKIKYPHVGTKCNDLARDMSGQLFEFLQSFSASDKLKNLKNIIRSLKPSWFRMLLSCNLISYVTGYQFAPELTSVCDILSHTASQQNHFRKCVKNKSESQVDWNRVRRLRACRSINIKRKGKTRLHAACETGDVEEVKALLTFPEIDLNGTDVNGWSALHIACRTGNTSCVRELLHGLPSDSVKFVNMRAKGPDKSTPLMCAVVSGHTEICQMLLRHAGVILLEDINEYNQTALDLSRSEEMTRILDYYKKNTSSGNGGCLPSIEFDEKYEELIRELCMEFLLNYFATYRTWDVCQVIKNKEIDSLSQVEQNFGTERHWDYNRYERDIMINLQKLKELKSNFTGLKQFENLNRVLSFINFSFVPS